MQHQGSGENEGAFKGGRRGIGRIFGIRILVFWNSPDLSINKASRSCILRWEGEKRSVSSTLHKIIETLHQIFSLFPCRRNTKEFYGKIMFTQKHSLGFQEHDVITKEAEASVVSTVCFCLLWRSVSSVEIM